MRKKQPHRSPWIAQLNKHRKIKELKRDLKTDILIVGAGIAGVTTAYYLLKDTQHTIALIDSGKMGHGATGHNAGQIASYFERPFKTLVEEFGFKKAIDAQISVLRAWDLIDHIVQEAELKHKPVSFAGFAGCTTIRQLKYHLHHAKLRAKGNVYMDFAYIVDNKKTLSKIPSEYKDLYSVVPKENILRKLETKDKSYIAAMTIRKGCMNSAKFCEELVEYMQKKYKSRLKFYENTHIQKITAEKTMVESFTPKNKITSQKVIICTNGYTKLEIKNTSGNKKTIHTGLVQGLVGFMAGYEKNTQMTPIAITYFPKQFNDPKDPYVYLTRRKLDNKKSLICIGGPDQKINNQEKYRYEKHYVKNGLSSIKKFVEKTHKFTSKNARYIYQWEGLMGYTKNKIRIAGKDPYNQRIMYNLGCNGVGILPSIYCSKRISLLVLGKKLKKSIFDPKNLVKKNQPRFTSKTFPKSME